MKKMHQSLISITLILSIVFGMSFGIAVGVSADATATTFNPGYGSSYNNTLPADWSSTGNLIKLGTWGNFQLSYSGSDKLIYDKYIWTSDSNFEYSFGQINVFSGTEACLYFYYTDSNNYYAVKFTADGTYLIKNINGTVSEITSAQKYYSKEIIIKITRTTAGDISVTTTPKGGTTATEVFEPVNDTTLTSGKIGMSCKNAGGYFSAIKATGSAYLSDSPNPSASPSVAPSSSPSTAPSASPSSSPGGNGTATTFNPNYGSADANTMPSGWNGSGYTLGTWGNFAYTTDNGGPTSGGMIYDKYIWTNDSNLEYSFGKVNFFNEFSDIYFCYKDSNNYYAVEFSSARTDIIKCVNGTKSSIEHVDTKYTGASYALKLTRTTAGAISLILTPESSTTPITVFNNVTDTTFTSGKIGFGYSTGSTFWNGGFLSVIKVTGSAYVSEDSIGIKFNPTDPKIARYLGRAFTLNNAVQMNFSLSGLEFMVSNANKVQLEMNKSGTRMALYAVFIDDAKTYEPIILNGTTFDYITIANLPDAGTHKIKFVKLTGIDTFINVKTIRAVGDGVTNPIISATQPKSRFIQFVGDSITVGYGLYDDTGSDTTEVSLRSYAGQTALYFDADVDMAAVSGASFVKDLTSAYGLNPFYTYGFNTGWIKGDAYIHDFTKATPDIVLVNIGTNDKTNNTVTHYVDFVNKIRTAYNDSNKNIPIILAIGTMDTSTWDNISTAVTQLNQSGDTKVYGLNLGYSRHAGVNYHPSIAEGLSTSYDVEAKIKEILPDWNIDTQIAVNAITTDANSVSVGFNTAFQTPNTNTYTVFGTLCDENGKLISIKKTTVSDSLNHNFVFNTANIANGTKCKAKLFMWNSNMQPVSTVGESPMFTITK